MAQFLEDNFLEPGSELLPWTPPDTCEVPEVVAKLRHPSLAAWGSGLNQLWSVLGRQVLVPRTGTAAPSQCTGVA